MCDGDLGGHVCVSRSLSFEEFAAKQQKQKVWSRFYRNVFMKCELGFFIGKMYLVMVRSIANVHYWPTINIQPHQRKLEFLSC